MLLTLLLENNQFWMFTQNIKPHKIEKLEEVKIDSAKTKNGDKGK